MSFLAYISVSWTQTIIMEPEQKICGPDLDSGQCPSRPNPLLQPFYLLTPLGRLNFSTFFSSICDYSHYLDVSSRQLTPFFDRKRMASAAYSTWFIPSKRHNFSLWIQTLSCVVYVWHTFVILPQIFSIILGEDQIKFFMAESLPDTVSAEPDLLNTLLAS